MKVALFLLVVIVASMYVQAAPKSFLSAKICPTKACDGKETFL
jgi:hypothetical protein